MIISSAPSPNFSSRKSKTVDMIVVHATAGHMPGTLSWMQDPKSKVSAHYLITRRGKIYQMVLDEKKAWHAGRSKWDGQGNLNDVSIGIELENDNVGEKYPDAQYNALLELSLMLVKKYGIILERVLRHKDIAPKRKTDPANFPWGKYKFDLTKLLAPEKPVKEVFFKKLFSFFKRIFQRR